MYRRQSNVSNEAGLNQLQLKEAVSTPSSPKKRHLQWWEKLSRFGVFLQNTMKRFSHRRLPNTLILPYSLKIFERSSTVDDDLNRSIVTKKP